MKYYTRNKKSMESIAIDKIEKGIRSMENGHRDGSDIGKDLEFFFNKLEVCNKGMYDELYMKYCTVRMKLQKETEDIHS